MQSTIPSRSLPPPNKKKKNVKTIQGSLLETQVASLVNVASAYLNAGQDAGREGTAHASIVPYQAFATKDGHLVVAAMNDRQFVRLYAPI